MVHSPDEDIDFCDIFVGVLQEDTLTPYISIHCLDYLLRTLIDPAKEIGFTLKKNRSRWYPSETKT